jgi:diacylglycerol kinase family enzyme
MLLRPAQVADLRVFPAPLASLDSKVAVVVNANARQVSEKVVRSLSHVVQEDDLFVSHSSAQVRRIALTLLERHYQIVFCGGGDGTFSLLVSELFKLLDRFSPQRRRLPRFGVLRLGTGNGLATLVRASPARGEGFLEDVLRARAGEVPGFRKLDLLLTEGKRAPFAGLGVDGKLLNDYLWVRSCFGKGPLKGLLSGRGGYLSAAALKTVPHYLTHSASVECEVINGNKGQAYRLGPNGSPVGEPIGPGDLIFRGPLMMAAAGTIPFYGFAFKMFPFAGKRRAMMHLRLGTASTRSILSNLPALWGGRWFPNGIQDFHAREVTVRFAKPMPLQIAGDAEGYREEVSIGIAPEHVELVDFSGAVN